MSISFKSFLLIFFLIFCCVSCTNNNVNEKETAIVKIEDSVFYTFDKKNTKIIWNGYKTSDKIKVVGFFTEFTTVYDDLDTIFNSPISLVSGLKFSINSASSSSGDEIRDSNLRQYFFNLLTEKFTINGVLGVPGSSSAGLECPSDSIDVIFNVFSIERKIRFGYSFDNKKMLIEIKGPIRLGNEFGAIKAYNAIHEKCYDLHKGGDGVSKTWDIVDVHVKVPVIEVSREL